MLFTSFVSFMLLVFGCTSKTTQTIMHSVEELYLSNPSHPLSQKQTSPQPFRHFETTPRSVWPSTQTPTDPYSSTPQYITFPSPPSSHPSTFQPSRTCTDGVDRPTIFVAVASYRDYMCSSTVANILGNARHPERVRVAVVEQNAGADAFSCKDTPVPCSADPAQPLCLHASNVEVFALPAPLATGPVFARSVGSALYNGETYAMQCDAHLEFVVDWDVDIIQQVRRGGGGCSRLGIPHATSTLFSNFNHWGFGSTRR